MSFARSLTLLLPLSTAACTAGRSIPSDVRAVAVVADTAGVGETQRRWWRSIATGDTAFLEAHSAPVLSLTLSSGRTLDRQETLRQAAAFASSAPPTFGWSDETVRLISPDIAVARTRATESAGLASDAFRYTTILERRNAVWQVTSAQSTREAVFTPRLTAAAAGPMGDYVGRYRGPAGGIVQVLARDSVLALVQPNGREIRLEPIGPSLFEFDYVVPAGVIVRLVFTRDAGGRVVSATRLIPGGVNTFVRVP